MPSRATITLATLLCASLAVNVRLWTTRSAAARPSSASLSAAGASSVAPPSPVDPEACPQRLAACEQRSWELVRRTIVVGAAPAPAEARPPTPAVDSAEAQDRTLCEKAKQGLRERWRRDRDAIAADILRSLTDPADQERNVTDEAGKMRVAAGLDDREAADVTRLYREKRLARVAEARVALGKSPQDFAAFADAARGLYADEDAILEHVAGSSAREAWRADQIEARTILIALTAAMADRDWDAASLHW